MLLLTSDPLVSEEMTQVEGRHLLREYGVLTRFLIFSAVSACPSRDTKPSPGTQTKQKHLKTRHGVMDKVYVLMTMSMRESCQVCVCVCVCTHPERIGRG